MKRKSVQKNKSKKVFKNVVFLIVLITIIGIFTSSNFAKQTVETSKVVVQNQDTLWNIAKNVCRDNSNLNIQNVISEIKEINQLSSSKIYVGQVLEVPIY